MSVLCIVLGYAMPFLCSARVHSCSLCMLMQSCLCMHVCNVCSRACTKGMSAIRVHINTCNRAASCLVVYQPL